ncbi:nucleoside-diphosphate sugar epimerase/dehydratase [Nocardia sp. NRRL S-836]|uniref:nucleoside-diphosphate sugar epimerase/dehydratase n=1 Tax=Nocardia sp. NRRL S-836 TaxID=1519492 RepID=UPI001E384E39|nr:hypothetical protein [Nocardia sp. NRRL S-836]
MITADVLTTVLLVVAVGAVMHSRHAAFGPLSLALLDILTVVVVVGSLAINRVWTPAVLGQGAEEFRRLGRGLFGAVVALGLGALAVDIPGARLWVFVVVPAIALVAFPLRYVLRRPLHRGRGEGRFMLSVLAAGNLETVEDLIHRTRRMAHLGWRVDAVCTLDGRGRVGPDVDGVPVVGSPTRSAAAATASSPSHPTSTGHLAVCKSSRGRLRAPAPRWSSRRA